MKDGNAIVSDFVHNLSTRSGLSITSTSISSNVFNVSGRIDSLLYVKGIYKAPYKWGVTNNVIARLRSQPRSWFVVLLHESEQTGYLLTSAQVEHNIKHVWPLAKDGDFKPSSGTYLETSTSFSTLDEVLHYLINSPPALKGSASII